MVVPWRWVSLVLLVELCVSAPTTAPTNQPSASPTQVPTVAPTLAPTNSPTLSPTGAPTTPPTFTPTASLTVTPTPSPTPFTCNDGRCGSRGSCANNMACVCSQGYSGVLCDQPPQGSCAYLHEEVNTPWVDPIASGHQNSTALSGSDDQQIRLNLPFPVWYYCQQYVAVYMNTNGFISYASAGSTPFAVNTPNPPTMMAAVYWSDWAPQLAGTVFFGLQGSAPNRVVVITWWETQHYTPGQPHPDDRVSFQVHLYENSTAIDMVYRNLTTHTSSISNGASQTIGIAGPGGSSVYSYNVPIVPNNFAVRFRRISTEAPTPAPTPLPTGAPVRVNCGGGAQNTVTTGGVVWQGDSSVLNASAPSSVLTSTANVTGTTLSQLFHTTRSWSAPTLAYSIPLCCSSSWYTVKLYFADGTGVLPGQRLFDVLLEGQTVVHKLDIVGRVGPNAALVLTYVIPIDDGVLHVKLIPQLRDALLNGIEITGPVPPSVTVAPTPFPTPAPTPAVSTLLTVPLDNGFAWQRLSGGSDLRLECLRKDTPPCRMLNSIVVKDNAITLFGGFQRSYLNSAMFNDVWTFNSSTARWRSVVPNNCEAAADSPMTLPLCREGHTAQVLGDYMYIVGGLATGTDYLGDVWRLRLSPPSSIWQRIPGSFPVFPSVGIRGAASTTATVALPQRDGVARPTLFFFGGEFRSRSDLLRTTLATFIRPSGTVLNFKIPRTTTTSIQFRSHLYAYTEEHGWTLLYAPRNLTGYVDCQINNAPQCARWPNLNYWKGNLYLWGGEKLGGFQTTTTNLRYGSNTTNEMWKFNISSATWTQVHGRNCLDLSLPPCRFAGSSFVRDSTLVVWGGVTGGDGLGRQWEAVNDRWEFNLVTEQWTRVTSQKCGNLGPVCSFWMGYAQTDQTAVVMGGQNFQTGSELVLNELWALRKVPVVDQLPGLYVVPTTGGVALTVDGAHFGDSAPSVEVKVGGRLCTNVVLHSRSRLSCRAPEGAGLSQKLQVRVFDAGQWVSASVPFVNYSAPIVSNISYNSNTGDGGTLGGGVLTVYGLNFGPSSEGAQVFIGSRACSPTTWVSPAQLTCIVPAGSGRGLPVSVSVAGQTGGAGGIPQPGSVTAFTYAGPQLQGWNVHRVNTDGGSRIVLLGRNLGSPSDVPLVLVGGRICNDTTWVNDTAVSCSAPPGTGANLNITLDIGGQRDTAANAFSYFPPHVTSYSPKSLVVNEQGSLTVTGMNFGQDVAGITMLFGDAGDICFTTVLQRISSGLSTLVCTTSIVKTPTTYQLSVLVSGQVSNSVTLPFVFAEVSDRLKAAARAVAVIAWSILIFLAVCTVVHRKNKVIRASSLEFLFVILLGASVLTAPLLFLEDVNIEEDNFTPCWIGWWLATCGFTTLYLALIIKNVRLLAIFSVDKLRLRPRALKTRDLLLLELAALAWDVVLLSILTWEVEDRCGDSHSAAARALVALILIPKVLIVLGGIVCAYKARVIHLPEFNEVQELAYAFYNVTVCLLFLGPAIAAVSNQPQINFILRLVGITVMGVGTVLCLFVPKLVKIHNTSGLFKPNSTYSVRSPTATSVDENSTNVSMAPVPRNHRSTNSAMYSQYYHKDMSSIQRPVPQKRQSALLRNISHLRSKTHMATSPSTTSGPLTASSSNTSLEALLTVRRAQADSLPMSYDRLQRSLELQEQAPGPAAPMNAVVEESYQSHLHGSTASDHRTVNTAALSHGVNYHSESVGGPPPEQPPPVPPPAHAHSTSGSVHSHGARTNSDAPSLPSTAPSPPPDTAPPTGDPPAVPPAELSSGAVFLEVSRSVAAHSDAEHRKSVLEDVPVD